MPDHSIEDLLAQRGIKVSYESIRLWCIKSGPKYARRLKRKQSLPRERSECFGYQGCGDTFFIDEVFVKIGGKQHYLWRQSIRRACPTKCFGYGEVIDVFLQARRDGKAAKRFFRRLIRNHQGKPRKVVTDKLRSYGVAHRELFGDA